MISPPTLPRLDPLAATALGALTLVHGDASKEPSWRPPSTPVSALEVAPSHGER